MATHDYNIANQSFPATRSDLNNALSAIKSSNSDSVAPTTSLVEGQLWWDTVNDVLKVYNGTAFEDVIAGPIVAADISTNAVTADAIAAGAVESSEIADNAVTSSELNVVGDGLATQFLRSDGDGSFTWATPTDTDTTYTAGSGIDLTGTTFSVQADLRDSLTHIGYDSGNFIYLSSASDYLGFTSGTAEVARMETDGDLHVKSSVVAYSSTVSDQNLKTAISTVDNALDKVSQLNGVEFTRKDSGQRSAGVIAQDVEKVLPQAVVERALPLQTGSDETYKTVEYDALHSLYIEAIKELKQIVEAQAKEIQELKNT